MVPKHKDVASYWMQVTKLGDGSVNVVRAKGTIHEAIQHTVEHYLEHKAPNGTVSVVPDGPTRFHVQGFDNDGEVERWTTFVLIDRSPFRVPVS